MVGLSFCGACRTEFFGWPKNKKDPFYKYARCCWLFDLWYFIRCKFSDHYSQCIYHLHSVLLSLYKKTTSTWQTVAAIIIFIKQ